MSSHRMIIRRLAGAFAAVSVLVLAALMISGAMRLVVSSGESMEPGISVNDLIVLRSQADYDVGDVVAYRNSDLGTVLHRIVDVKDDDDGRRFVLQGDNNDFLDSEEPLRSAILGQSVLVVPKGGRAIGLLPLIAAAAFALYWMFSDSAANAGSLSSTSGRWGSLQPRSVAGMAVVAAGLTLGVYALVAPSSEVRSRQVRYQTEVAVSWQAQAPPSVVYPDGELTTNDPIFLAEIDEVDVSAAITGPDNATDVSGTASLIATVSDDSGWSRDIVLGSPTEIEAGQADLSGTLDLDELTELLEQVGSRTGFVPSRHDVTLSVGGMITGEVAGRRFTDNLDHHVALTLDHLKLAPTPTTLWGQVASNDVTIEETAEQRVGLGWLSLSIGTARLAALFAVLAGLGLMATRRGEMEEHELISRRFAGFVMPASTVALPSNISMVEVDHFEDLLRIAQIEGSPILELERDTYQWFTVAFGIWYRYEIVKATIASTTPAPSTELVTAGSN